MLVAGKEESYFSHFFNKLAYDAAAIGPEDVAHYMKVFEQSEAKPCVRDKVRFFGVCERE